MGEMLDRIDRQIDVNAVIMKRCLESAVDLVGGHITPEFYGPDTSPLSIPGVVDMARAMFEHVRRNVTTLNGDEDANRLIDEYRAEEEAKKRLALEERAQAESTATAQG